MRLAFSQHRDGVETAPGPRVVYDVARDEARLGAASVAGHALVWELTDTGEGEPLELGPGRHLLRCDRVDFPPGGVAHLHTHPGPGIRCLLAGSLRVDTDGRSRTYTPFQEWFEPGPEPVLAVASEHEPTSFVRVLVLPREWAGRRTIRYVDPADGDSPKLQRVTVFLDEPVELA